jgi:hypothetical protein
VTQNIFSTRVLIKFLLLPVFGIPVGAPVAMGDEGASPAYAPGSMSESPGGFGSGPSASRGSDAPSSAPYSLFSQSYNFPISFCILHLLLISFSSNH